MKNDKAPLPMDPRQRKILVRILSAAAFLVLFQGYLLTPLISMLANDFHAPLSAVGLMIPLYTIPYGLSTLVYGPLSDFYGRKAVLLFLLALMALCVLLTTATTSIMGFLTLRIAMGLVTGGIVPIAVAQLGDLYPYAKRGKPLGLLYGAMAGGMAFGSTLGAYLDPLIGWRMEFVLTGLASVFVFLLAWRSRRLFPQAARSTSFHLRTMVKGCCELVNNKRGRQLYSFVFLNGMFHSGVFSWLGYYFLNIYHLGSQKIGLALLGYGVPGMLLGISIGKWADRYGRGRILPFGLLSGALAVTVLSFHPQLWMAALAVALLSLGYDMTQPLFAAMVTTLGGAAVRGQAVGLSACLLFLGYGAGSLVFQSLLASGLHTALLCFAGAEAVLAVIAIRVFQTEKSGGLTQVPSDPAERLGRDAEVRSDVAHRNAEGNVGLEF